MSRPGVRGLFTLPLLLALIPFVGCTPHYRRPAGDPDMFGPQAVRIHPTFTRTKDWTGDGNPDGIEAVVELQDQFGEPTRATGRVMFEIYPYRQYYPDPRGKRSPDVWQWPLTTRGEQVEHWSRALRAYSFKIPFNPGKGTVVLAATFALGGGTPRLFDQIILEPEGRTAPVPEAATQPTRPRRPATQPATGPIEPIQPPETPGPLDMDSALPPERAPERAPEPPPKPATEPGPDLLPPPADAPKPSE